MDDDVGAQPRRRRRPWPTCWHAGLLEARRALGLLARGAARATGSMVRTRDFAESIRFGLRRVRAPAPRAAPWRARKYGTGAESELLFGDPWASAYRVGPHPELIGRRVTQTRRPGASGARRDRQPGPVRARRPVGADPADARDRAPAGSAAGRRRATSRVAVNGRIRAVGRSFHLHGRQHRVLLAAGARDRAAARAQPTWRCSRWARAGRWRGSSAAWAGSGARSGRCRTSPCFLRTSMKKQVDALRGRRGGCSCGSSRRRSGACRSRLEVAPQLVGAVRLDVVLEQLGRPLRWLGLGDDRRAGWRARRRAARTMLATQQAGADAVREHLELGRGGRARVRRRPAVPRAAREPRARPRRSAAGCRTSRAGWPGPGQRPSPPAGAGGGSEPSTSVSDHERGPHPGPAQPPAHAVGPEALLVRFTARRVALVTWRSSGSASSDRSPTPRPSSSSGRCAIAPPGGRAARPAARAGAPARVHARQAHRAGRPADGRGLVPRAGHRGRGHGPRRPRDLPRPRPAGGLPDHGGGARRGLRPHDGGRDRRGARPTRAIDAEARDDAVHRRLGRRRQDRVDRRARVAGACRCTGWP